MLSTCLFCRSAQPCHFPWTQLSPPWTCEKKKATGVTHRHNTDSVGLSLMLLTMISINIWWNVIAVISCEKPKLQSLTCCPSSEHPTPVSTGRWHYDGVLVSPHRSAHAPSSSAGTLLFLFQSSTWSCPQSLSDQVFDSKWQVRQTDTITTKTIKM